MRCMPHLKSSFSFFKAKGEKKITRIILKSFIFNMAMVLQQNINSLSIWILKNKKVIKPYINVNSYIFNGSKLSQLFLK